MKRIRAYKTELKLNNVQRSLCEQHAGVARFAYNWGLDRKLKAYETSGKSPSAMTLHRELNALKPTEFPWMYAVSKCAPQEALRDLAVAYKNFFRRVKQGKNGKKGFPKFKSKHRSKQKFRLTGRIRVFAAQIQLPRLGRLRLTEKGYLPVAGTPDVRILSATVSERAGRWYVSVQVEEIVPDRMTPKGQPVGVDLGIKELATLSDGTQYANPRALKSALKKIKRLQHTVSRRQKGSANRRKAIAKLARAHARVANIRSNTLHQITSELAKTKPFMAIEDLHVAGLLRNHNLAQAISDVGFHEFKRQLEYKTVWYGSELVAIDRWFPSSKTCSRCGQIDSDQTLGDRLYVCACGLELDRDHNAAINILNKALHTASSAGIHACGDHVRPASNSAGRIAEAGTKHQIDPVIFVYVLENGLR